MATVEIHEVVTILANDESLVIDWERFSGGLKIQDAEMQQWRNLYRLGAMTSYSLVRCILSKWISAQGSVATVETLTSVLLVEGFVAIAERIKEAFPPNSNIVDHGPSSLEMDVLRQQLPSTSAVPQGRHLTPRDGKELKVTLAQCQDGDTITLAKATKYIGHFTINACNVSLAGGGAGAEIVCQDDAAAVYMLGDGCTLSGLNVFGRKKSCITVAGNNNKIHNCNLFLTSVDDSSFPALLVTSKANTLEKVCTSLDKLIKRGIRVIKAGLQIEGVDVACSQVTVVLQRGSLHPGPYAAGVISTAASERMLLESCVFQCDESLTNQIMGSAHSLIDVDFTKSVTVLDNKDPVRMERCVASKLAITKTGKVDWLNCTFQKVKFDATSSGSAP